MGKSSLKPNIKHRGCLELVYEARMGEGWAGPPLAVTVTLDYQLKLRRLKTLVYHESQKYRWAVGSTAGCHWMRFLKTGVSLVTTVQLHTGPGSTI